MDVFVPAVKESLKMLSFSRGRADAQVLTVVRVGGLDGTNCSQNPAEWNPEVALHDVWILKIRSESNLLKKHVQLLKPSAFNSSAAAGLNTLHTGPHFTHLWFTEYTHTHTQSQRIWLTDWLTCVCVCVCVCVWAGTVWALFWTFTGTFSLFYIFLTQRRFLREKLKVSVKWKHALFQKWKTLEFRFWFRLMSAALYSSERTGWMVPITRHETLSSSSVLSVCVHLYEAL